MLLTRNARNKGYEHLKLFWDFMPADKKIFVADSAHGSRHNRGCAVDLSLFDLKTGQTVKMPSEYDEMTERSHINYECSTDIAKFYRERCGRRT